MSNPQAVIIEAAFNMLRPILETMPNGPKTAGDFYDRLAGTVPAPITQPPDQPEARLFKAGRLLSVEQTAERIGCTTKTIHNMIKDGRLVHFRAGHFLRVPEGALADLLTGGKQVAP